MTFNVMFTSLFILLGVFALGDVLGISTKSRLSSVFVALMTFLILFMTGIVPHDIVARARFDGLASWALPFMVFHMGTSLSIEQMKREWRIVLGAAYSMAAAAIGVIALWPILGREGVIVTIPVISGGIVSTGIMAPAARAQGFYMAASLAVLIFIVKRFVGTAIASYNARAAAKIFIEEYREKKAQGITLRVEDEGKEKSENSTVVKPQLWQKVEKYWTSYIVLGVCAMFVFISSILGQITPFIPMSVWALFLGIIAAALGLVPPNIMNKGICVGLFLVGAFASLIPSIADITLEGLLTLGLQMAMIFAAVLVSLFVFMGLVPIWKFLGSRNLAAGVAMSQLLAFPATFLIVTEVAIGLSENEEEKQYLIKKLSPSFVVSGFVSVTTLSVIVAGVLVAFL